MSTCPECLDNTNTLTNVKTSDIILVGNMNVGKSTLFSRLCSTEISSYKFPHTTVSIQKGRINGTDKNALLTPGIYSIFSTNEDETVSRDILLFQGTTNSVPSILLVADAKNLKRSVAITLQYAEYGLPMLFDLNMVDEAASHGIKIQYDKLAAALDINVCASIARESIGVRKIISKLNTVRIPKRLIRYPDWVETFLKDMRRILGNHELKSRALGLLLLSEDHSAMRYINKRYGTEILNRLKSLASENRQAEPEEFKLFLVNLYNKKAEQIVREVQTVEPRSKSPFLEIFGDYCARLSTGIPIAIGVLYIMYLFVGVFGATYLVDTINSVLFEGFLIPLTTKLVGPIPNKFIKDMIIDPDFGILPTGVFLALGLVMPVLFCFYLAFGLLEDSGYLPRLSILLDKLFIRMGLNGKGVVPLVMGFSCVTMAILTTRMLGTKKERNIATFLLLLGMPCAPLIAVMLIILEKMPVSATFTVFGIIFLQVIIAGIVLNNILPGVRSPFIMEIPPLRLPKFLEVIQRATLKTFFFTKEAVPVFMLAALTVFLFEKLGGLQMLEQILKPLTTSLMGLPEKSVQVFIKTLIRRESGAAELEHLSGIYSNLQLVINLLVMTFLTPCINAIIVLIKERGAKTAAVLIGSVLVYAVTVGTIINHTCRILGVTFS